jgi:hypothetical protein
MKYPIYNKLLTLLAFFLLFQCQTSKGPYVQTISQSDTVNIDEMYEARIFLKNVELDQYPTFFVILSTNDTVYLPYDRKEKCAIYHQKSRLVGQKQWQGHVSYTQKDKQRELVFEDKFFVKE